MSRLWLKTVNVVLLTSAYLRSDRLSGVRCSSMVQVFNLGALVFGNSMATNFSCKFHGKFDIFELVQSNVCAQRKR